MDTFASAVEAGVLIPTVVTFAALVGFGIYDSFIDRKQLFPPETAGKREAQPGGIAVPHFETARPLRQAA